MAKPLNKVKLVFCGDIRNNMAYALMYGAAKTGMHFVGPGPQELTPDPEVLAQGARGGPAPAPRSRSPTTSTWRCRAPT